MGIIILLAGFIAILYDLKKANEYDKKYGTKKTEIMIFGGIIIFLIALAIFH